MVAFDSQGCATSRILRYDRYMEFKSKDVQTIFNRSQETVRKWAVEFAKFLSPTATPGTGHHRLFTLSDLEVFALVAEMKDNRKPPDEIHAALVGGQRGDVSQLDLDHTRDTGKAIQLDLAQQRMTALATERDVARAELQTLRERYIRLTTSEELARKRVEEISTELESVRQKSQEEIAHLQREIGRLEAQLEMAHQKNKQPDTE